MLLISYGMDQSFLEGNKHNAGKIQEPWDTLVTLAAYPALSPEHLAYSTPNTLED